MPIASGRNLQSASCTRRPKRPSQGFGPVHDGGHRPQPAELAGPWRAATHCHESLMIRTEGDTRVVCSIRRRLGMGSLLMGSHTSFSRCRCAGPQPATCPVLTTHGVSRYHALFGGLLDFPTLHACEDNGLTGQNVPSAADTGLPGDAGASHNKQAPTTNRHPQPGHGGGPWRRCGQRARPTAHYPGRGTPGRCAAPGDRHR